MLDSEMVFLSQLFFQTVLLHFHPLHFLTALIQLLTFPIHLFTFTIQLLTLFAQLLRYIGNLISQFLDSALVFTHLPLGFV
jgi:hypothetical protein